VTGPFDRDLTVSALKRALPYIRLYKSRVFVVKAGGAMCGDAAALRNLAEQLSVLRELGIRVVFVHGGGPQTTALSEQLGVKTTFVEGRRITDAKTLEVAVMTLNGSANTAILAACRAASLPALGLSGVDCALIRATRRPVQIREVGGQKISVDYGLVGNIASVDVSVLHKLLDAGIVPIISPLAADDAGQVLNINADTVASTIARELAAEKLVFMTDTAGLLEDKSNPASLVSYTDVKGLAALQARGVIDAGMLPKIKAAKEALLGGVKRVHMVGYRGDSPLLVEVFTNEGAGTLIVKDASELLPAEQAAAAKAGAAGA
jgi:acetylglutamate kinase